MAYQQKQVALVGWDSAQLCLRNGNAKYLDHRISFGSDTGGYIGKKKSRTATNVAEIPLAMAAIMFMRAENLMA